MSPYGTMRFIFINIRLWGSYLIRERFFQSFISVPNWYCASGNLGMQGLTDGVGSQTDA